MVTEHLDAVMAVEVAAYPFPWTRGNFVDSLAAGHAAFTLWAPDGGLLGYFVAMAGVDEMHLLQPSTNIQLSRKSPDHFLRHALRVIGKGYGFPSIFNADAVVQEQLRQGKSLEDARAGGCSGCVEVGAFGKEAYILTGYFNMPKCLELALHNHVYEDIATKFFEHFLHIAAAMSRMVDADTGLWDEEDQFYYDVLTLPDARRVRLRMRSMVGLIPLFAVETLEPELLERLPGFRARMEWFLQHRPDLAGLVSHWHKPGRGERRLLSLLRGHRMKMILRRMLDESEFLSDHGIRSLSRAHLENPYVLRVAGGEYAVRYSPGESETRQFGGNSNWRGPIWFPLNYLIIESLQKFHHYYGDDFTVECPVGTGRRLSLAAVAEELSQRLAGIFLRDAAGARPVFGGRAQLQGDPHFRDHIPFHEYFHGDTGRGCGASHQTGWTALVARLLMPRRRPGH